MTETSPGTQDTNGRSDDDTNGHPGGDWTPSHSLTVPAAQPTVIRTKEDVERAVSTAPTVPNQTVPVPSGWTQVPVTPLQAPPPIRQSGSTAAIDTTGTPPHSSPAPSTERAGHSRDDADTSGSSAPAHTATTSDSRGAVGPESNAASAGPPLVDGHDQQTFGRHPGAGPSTPLPPPNRVTPDGAPQSVSAGPEAGLDELALLRPPKRPSRHGLRKLVYTASAGSINLGPSAAEQEHDELVTRITAPIRGRYKIAFMSIKGGVGKTTVANTVGSTFASVRGDRVIAIDANPDLGTLADRVHREHEYTVRDLLADKNVRTYSDVRRYTSQADSRLEVLASEVDPTTAEAFSAQDYLDTLRILEVHYNIVLTDCGTGISHSAMQGILTQADALVIVSSTAHDGARSALATLSWLTEHGYKDLVSHSMVAINSLRPGPGALDTGRLEHAFRSRGVRGVAMLPYDAHLAEGGPVEMGLLAKRTANAYLQLAASLADDFARLASPRP